MGRKWTEEEEKFLSGNRDDEVEVLAEQLNRTVGAVKSRISKIEKGARESKKALVEAMVEHVKKETVVNEEPELDELEVYTGVSVPIKKNTNSNRKGVTLFLLIVAGAMIAYGWYY